MDLICSRCKNPILPEANFCPRCGKKIKEPSPATSLGAHIKVYLVSILFPPFGLGYAYKYLRYGDKKGKIVGWVAIILTILGIAFLIWTNAILFKRLNQSFQNLSF